MSIAEFYVDNGIDAEDWDAPNGMGNFLRSHAEDNTNNNNRKRGRDDYDDDDEMQQPDAVHSNSGTAEASNFRPAKRLKSGRNLVSFETPFPCAFTRKGGCRYRATCSYHHGVAVACDCDNIDCDKGHPHRRPPQRCDHGRKTECRWNLLKECSFHHGIPATCFCDSIDCTRAHPTRVKRNTEERANRRKETKQEQQKKAKKPKSHYKTWKKKQKKVKTGETNQQLRQRYLQLFPECK